MRLIGTLGNENEARRFATYLKQQGIDANCEVAFDAQTGHLSYHLWIVNEDQINVASEALKRFQETPSHQEFNLAVPPPPPTPSTHSMSGEAKTEEIPKRAVAPVTAFFLSLCIFVFLLSWYQQNREFSSTEPSGNLLMTPIQEAFFFDLPPAIDEISQVSGATLQKEIEAQEQALEKMTYWHGAYDWFIDKFKGKSTKDDEGPLFYRIGEGEFWRLFTPVLLHGGFLHILFNMIWLWVLGIPIETRIGMFRTLLLTLIIGVGSNVFQYLMGGPFFLGYSGIVVGFAGFIWVREKTAPWEGYPLQRSTVLFLLLFVFGMFGIQFTSFMLQLFTNIAFSPNIANTGHISGGIIGILLGYSRLFSMRPK